MTADSHTILLVHTLHTHCSLHYMKVFYLQLVLQGHPCFGHWPQPSYFIVTHRRTSVKLWYFHNCVDKLPPRPYSTCFKTTAVCQFFTAPGEPYYFNIAIREYNCTAHSYKCSVWFAFSQVCHASPIKQAHSLSRPSLTAAQQPVVVTWSNGCFWCLDDYPPYSGYLFKHSLSSSFSLTLALSFFLSVLSVFFLPFYLHSLAFSLSSLSPSLRLIVDELWHRDSSWNANQTGWVLHRCG